MGWFIYTGWISFNMSKQLCPVGSSDDAILANAKNVLLDILKGIKPLDTVIKRDLRHKTIQQNTVDILQNISVVIEDTVSKTDSMLQVVDQCLKGMQLRVYELTYYYGMDDVYIIATLATNPTEAHKKFIKWIEKRDLDTTDEEIAEYTVDNVSPSDEVLTRAGVKVIRHFYSGDDQGEGEEF